MIPIFSHSGEALEFYANRGGILGIIDSAKRKYLDEIKRVLEEANKLWKSAFPSSKVVIESTKHLRRLKGIFKAHAKRRPEIRKYYEKFERLADYSRDLDGYYFYIERLDEIQKSYRDLIRVASFADLPKITDIIRDVAHIMERLQSIFKFFEDEKKLSELFIEHSAILYTRYEGNEERNIDFVLVGYAHAELLFIEMLRDESLGPLAEKEHDVLVHFAARSSYRNIIDIANRTEFGLDWKKFAYGYGFVDRPLALVIYDKDYGVERDSVSGRFPWDWWLIDTNEILDRLGIRPQHDTQKLLTEFFKKFGKKPEEKTVE